MQSPNNPGYVIRGVTSDDGESTSQPRVSVFTDGVSTSRSRASVSELFDMERIEVSKGPQGTLFGRGAEIGGISLIRNKAKDYLSAELEARYGAYNTRQVTGFINTPIVKGKLANRFDQAQSMYIASDAGRAHLYGVEAALTWSPIRELTFFGNYSYIEGKFNDKDENGNKQEYAGNRFRLMPKNSFTIGADFELCAGKAGSFYFRPTYTFKSKIYFNDDNQPAQTAYGTYELSQKGYGLCNFTLGWRYQPKKVYYELGMFGKNIFDEKYIIEAGNSGRNIVFPTFIGGTRSVIGVQAKIGF